MKLLRITLIIVILLFIGGFYYLTFSSDPQSILFELLEDRNQGFTWIILIVFGLILLSTLTGLPVLYFSIALGFFMNYIPALAIAWIINLAAILLTFFMVKKVFSSYFTEKYGKRKFIQKINSRVQKYGFRTVAMSRGIYVIPTNIINFSFPLSKISSKQYIIGSMIGLIPECLINITTGYLLKHQILLLNSPQQNLVKISVVGVFLLLMAIGIIILYYRRKRVEKARMNEFLPPIQDEENN